MDRGFCKQRKLLLIFLNVSVLVLKVCGNYRLSVGGAKLASDKSMRWRLVNRMRRGRPERKAVVRQKDFKSR